MTAVQNRPAKTAKTPPATPAAPSNGPATPAAPTGEKADRTVNTKPLIDYSALTADDANPADIALTRKSSSLDLGPFPGFLADSRDRKVAKSVRVPESAAKQTVYLVRKSAQSLNIGVRVVASEPVNGQVTVTFQAKTKRAYTPRDKSADTAAS